MNVSGNSKPATHAQSSVDVVSRAQANNADNANPLKPAALQPTSETRNFGSKLHDFSAGSINKLMHKAKIAPQKMKTMFGNMKQDISELKAKFHLPCLPHTASTQTASSERIEWRGGNINEHPKLVEARKYLNQIIQFREESRGLAQDAFLRKDPVARFEYQMDFYDACLIEQEFCIHMAQFKMRNDPENTARWVADADKHTEAYKRWQGEKKLFQERSAMNHPQFFNNQAAQIPAEFVEQISEIQSENNKVR